MQTLPRCFPYRKAEVFTDMTEQIPHPDLKTWTDNPLLRALGPTCPPQRHCWACGCRDSKLRTLSCERRSKMTKPNVSCPQGHCLCSPQTVLLQGTGWLTKLLKEAYRDSDRGRKHGKDRKFLRAKGSSVFTGPSNIIPYNNSLIKGSRAKKKNTVVCVCHPSRQEAEASLQIHGDVSRNLKSKTE